jgi:hypothetical protein
MAQPANTFDAYDAGNSNAEDVHDKIYMVSPEATPVLSAGRRFKANQKTHEWLRDNLATPSASNAVIEGDDRTGTAITAPDRVANLTQLMDKVAVVSTSQQKSKQIGRSNEMKYQVAKMMTELKRDVEARLVSNSPAVAGNSTTARQTGGLGVLVYTTALHNGSGATAAHTSGAPTTAVTAGTNRAFTEALLATAMQSVYTNSGTMPSFITMTPSHKTTFATFTGIAANRYNMSGKAKQATIIGGADIYLSSFGELAVVPNYVQATSAANDVFILNPDTYGVAYLQGFNSVPLAKTGHTEKELVSVECAMVVTAEKSNAKIANLTA